MSKITEAARGIQCQIRIPRICNHDPATSVWCHANGSAAGKGIGMKAPDILGAIGCSACHDIYDRRRLLPDGLTRDDIALMFWTGHARSILILIEKGIIVQERGKVIA